MSLSALRTPRPPELKRSPGSSLIYRCDLMREPWGVDCFTAAGAVPGDDRLGPEGVAFATSTSRGAVQNVHFLQPVHAQGRLQAVHAQGRLQVRRPKGLLLLEQVRQERQERLLRREV